MAERTAYDAGTPSWVDLTSTDPETAKGFYATVFGWDGTDESAGDQGVYTMFLKDGKAVAGMMAMTDEEASRGGPGHWNTYITVDSADDAAATAAAAGGTVLVPPMDATDAGRMAVIQDPTGAIFGVWEARNHIGAQLVNEHGALTWTELISTDAAAAEKFYTDVFGYGKQVMDTPNGPYVVLTLGDAGGIAGLMATPPSFPDGIPSSWGVYFHVDDVDATVAAVTEHGGSVYMPPWDAPGVGRLATVGDPHGVAFSVITPPAEG